MSLGRRLLLGAMGSLIATACVARAAENQPQVPMPPSPEAIAIVDGYRYALGDVYRRQSLAQFYQQGSFGPWAHGVSLGVGAETVGHPRPGPAMAMPSKPVDPNAGRARASDSSPAANADMTMTAKPGDPKPEAKAGDKATPTSKKPQPVDDSFFGRMRRWRATKAAQHAAK